MDPNANLEEQRRIVMRMLDHSCSVSCSCNQCAHDGARLAELVKALDEWITKGGFLPQAWSRK